MPECNTVNTPGYGPELFDEQPEEKQLGSRNIKLYQAIVGSLLYFLSLIHI